MKENTITTTTNRTEYFDYLRIFATFSVILLHVAAEYWYTGDVTTNEWMILNTYNCFVRWTVPVFVMISGTLFLEKEHSISKLYKKNIFRLITAFLFWSVLYAVIDSVQKQLSLTETLSRIVKGHFHMWFIFMIVGLYIITPLLKRIVDSMKLTKYFIIICVIFSFLIPNLVTTTAYFNWNIGTFASEAFDQIFFYFTYGFVGFFVLGYYLNRIDTKGKIKWLIYAMGLIGFAITLFMTTYISRLVNYSDGNFQWYLTINVLMQSVSVFVFAKNNWNSLKVAPVVKKVIREMSKYSFGAYLVHAMIMEQLDINFGLNSLSFNPIISVPVISLLIFVISYGISAIINHIPFFKKYIV